MKFKVPDIYDLVESEVQSIRDKEKQIEQLKSNFLNDHVCNSLQKEVEKSKKLLSKFKQELRTEKLKRLGI